MAYLLVTSGQSAGTSFDLTKCPVSIGRDETQDIRLPERHVSPSHLLVERNANETYTVKAQPTVKLGMLVNDKAVAEAILANGDRIRIGDTEILFLATDQASQVEAVKRVRVWSTTPIAKPRKRLRRKAK
jgi:pSer/pThr/pTyr-binding forkhead associated (FHA) protein